MTGVFQLTTSRRGRRIRLGYSFSLSYFNSLPHAEVDQKLQMLQQRWKYFNSLPHAEVDAEYDVISSGASKFQLTTSRRGRPECGIRIFYQYSYFNSLPHAEVDGGGFGGNGGNGTFQLTTSRRGRPYILHFRKRHRYFNSLPHAEVDISMLQLPVQHI